LKYQREINEIKLALINLQVESSKKESELKELLEAEIEEHQETKKALAKKTKKLDKKSEKIKKLEQEIEELKKA
jgi:hypothetical protein